jgi:hypothetical protein
VRLTIHAARLEPMSGHAASFVDYGAEILKILCHEETILGHFPVDIC